ncbi:hypothetical protein AMJ50_01950 [Parcubacteria bacterium DG_74_3]|nr:MAG: hypothetical protein AMJ50_01950 [Parcubacteria bacterium DG_74_3]
MKKISLLIIFFYLIALIQTSFLIHFKILRFFPNLILVFQILLTLLEEPKEKLTLFSAIFAGFFWDIFSENPLGLGILILFSITFFLKLVLRKYVRFPFLKRI